MDQSGRTSNTGTDSTSTPSLGIPDGPPNPHLRLDRQIHILGPPPPPCDEPNELADQSGQTSNTCRDRTDSPPNPHSHLLDQQIRHIRFHVGAPPPPIGGPIVFDKTSNTVTDRTSISGPSLGRRYFFPPSPYQPIGGPFVFDPASNTCTDKTSFDDLFPPHPISVPPRDPISVPPRDRPFIFRNGPPPPPPTPPPDEPNEPKVEFEKGTTTLGFLFNNEGIIVAVDHSYTDAPFPENVLPINSHLLVAFSGGSEISRSFLLKLPEECSEAEHTKGSKFSATELKDYVSSFLSRHPDSDNSLSLGILIAGWDCELGLPSLYKVDGMGKFSSDSILSTGHGSRAVRLIISMRGGHCWCLGEAIGYAMRALYMGVYRAPTSLDCLAVFYIGAYGVQTLEINQSIPSFQKHDFAIRGSIWEEPSKRRYIK